MRNLDHFQRDLAAKAELTEAALDRFLIGEATALSSAQGRFNPHDQNRLLDAMRYSALGGGKRIRPYLVSASAALFDGDEAEATRAGCALELIHCYSLVHDDLPSMDDDELRRGKPTLHRAFDEATAILAGDALLTLAFELLASPQGAISAETRLALVGELARASGFVGMVHGQMLDLAAEGRFSEDGRAAAKADWRPRQLDTPAIETLQRKKTGALIRCAVRMGTRIGRASDADLQALTNYARASWPCLPDC